MKWSELAIGTKCNSHLFAGAVLTEEVVFGSYSYQENDDVTDLLGWNNFGSSQQMTFVSCHFQNIFKMPVR